MQDQRPAPRHVAPARRPLAAWERVEPRATGPRARVPFRREQAHFHSTLVACSGRLSGLVSRRRCRPSRRSPHARSAPAPSVAPWQDAPGTCALRRSRGGLATAVRRCRSASRMWDTSGGPLRRASREPKRGRGSVRPYPAQSICGELRVVTAGACAVALAHDVGYRVPPMPSTANAAGVSNPSRRSTSPARLSLERRVRTGAPAHGHHSGAGVRASRVRTTTSTLPPRLQRPAAETACRRLRRRTRQSLTGSRASWWRIWSRAAA
jgi:hypothetical protein